MIINQQQERDLISGAAVKNERAGPLVDLPSISPASAVRQAGGL